MTEATQAIWMWGTFDARPWSNTVIGKWGATDITIATFDLTTGGPAGGIFNSAESFFSGHGSPSWDAAAANRRDMQSEMVAEWASSGSANIPTWTITSDDRIRIAVSGGSVQITACSNPAAFGLDGVSFPTAAGLSYTFPNAFSRELLRDETITFTNEIGALTPLPSVNDYRARVLHLSRQTSATTGTPIDVDDEGLDRTLMAALNAAGDATSNRIRCHLLDDQRLEIAWPTAVTGSPTFVHPSGATDDEIAAHESFRRRIGFTGLETVTVDSGLSYIRGTLPVQGCFHSTVGVAGARGITIDSQGRAAPAGETGAIGWSPGVADATTIAFHLEGPAGPSHAGQGFDLDHHFRRRFADWIEPGSPVRIVLGKDWRRYMNVNDVDYNTRGTSLLRSTDCTSSAWMARRAPNDRAFQYSYTRDKGGMYAVTRATFVDDQDNSL